MNNYKTYQKNREEFTQRVWETLRKNFVPLHKKDAITRKKSDDSLDVMTPIWYNTTINNKEK